MLSILRPFGAPAQNINFERRITLTLRLDQINSMEHKLRLKACNEMGLGKINKKLIKNQAKYGYIWCQNIVSNINPFTNTALT